MAEVVAKVERLGRRATQTEVSLVAVTCAVVLLVLGLVAYQGYKLRDVTRRLNALTQANRESLVRQNELAGNAVGCIVLRLERHRQANEYAHQLLARELGAVYDEPQELVPQPLGPELAESCQRLESALKAQNGGK